MRMILLRRFSSSRCPTYLRKVLRTNEELEPNAMKCRRRRRILTKDRGGTAGLEVETGRWWGVSREKRLCKNCQSEEVEDMEHLLMRCSSVAYEREKLVRLMRKR